VATTPQERTTLRRSLSVWQAVGISVALMAPRMAANINPQGTAGQVGRATPLAFFLAAIAVLLTAYVSSGSASTTGTPARSTCSRAPRSVPEPVRSRASASWAPTSSTRS
jgi:hypothetical protein